METKFNKALESINKLNVVIASEIFTENHSDGWKFIGKVFNIKHKGNTVILIVVAMTTPNGKGTIDMFVPKNDDKCIHVSEFGGSVVWGRPAYALKIAENLIEEAIADGDMSTDFNDCIEILKNKISE